MELTPDSKLGRIELSADPERRWSMLIPENIAGCGECLMHCHNRPPEWVSIERGWSMRQSDDARGFRWKCDVTVVSGGVAELVFELFNESKAPLTDGEADFCFACAYGAWNTRADAIEKSWTNPPFHGHRKEWNNDWTRRSFVPTQAGLTMVGDINLHFPVSPHHSVAGQNLADLPIILCQSEDRQETYAAGWERCNRLYCAMGSCIHTVVWLGAVGPGKSARRRGRFYCMRSDPYQVLARFQRDLSLE